MVSWSRISGNVTPRSFVHPSRARYVASTFLVFSQFISNVNRFSLTDTWIQNANNYLTLYDNMILLKQHNVLPTTSVRYISELKKTFLDNARNVIWCLERVGNRFV
jgi:hypothetical protein